MPQIFNAKFVDMVRATTTSQGTGPFVPGPAVPGFSSFADSLAAGDMFYYSAQGVEKPKEREVGRGVYQANGTIARQPLRGSLTSFTAGTKTISVVAASEWYARLSAVADQADLFASVPSRVELAKLDGLIGASRMLLEPGREGVFTWDANTEVAVHQADVMQGVYVAPVPTSPGAWVRQGDVLTPFMFGAQSNYQIGSRSTGIPPYGESAQEGSRDGALVDARPACQAMLDLIRAHPNRRFVGDFSGGLWGIARRNDGGAHNRDGLVIDQPGEYPRTFIGGEFRGIGEGRNLIYVDEGQYSQFSGHWHVRSGADGGSSYGYPARRWENGIWLRNSAQCRWGPIKVSGFQRWGIDFDPEFSWTDYNNNIGARFERIYGNNNGSAVDRETNCLTLPFTASVRSGSSRSTGQRTRLTLGAGHDILRVNDVIRTEAGSYHVILEKEGPVVSVYPWIVSTAANGLVHSCHGGVIRTAGKDVAGAGADALTGVNNGATLDIANSLHGTQWGNVILEGGGLGMICGTHNGINLGHSISHMHSEANSLDLLALNAANTELLIGSCSAWAEQDYLDPFKLTQVLAANDGNALATDIGLPQIGIFVGGRWLTSGTSQGADSTSTKSRAYAPVLCNHDEIRKVQAPGAPTNVTLKYRESIDRCIRNAFVAQLEVVSPTGGAPSAAVVVTLDAADKAAGITLNGGSSPYVIENAGGPVRVSFWLDTSGTTRNWVPVLAAAGGSSNSTDPSFVGSLSLSNAGGSRRMVLTESGTQHYLQAGTPGATAANGVLNVSGINGQELASCRLSANEHVYYSYGVAKLLIGAGDTQHSGHFNLAGGALKIGGNQVVGNRQMGWTPAIGTPLRGAFAATAAGSVSTGYVQAEAQASRDRIAALEARLIALEADCRSHGLIN